MIRSLSLALLYTLVLLAFPRIVAAQGGPMAWYDASFGGTVVKVYGWRDAAGLIHWEPSQNPHVTPDLAARLKPVPPVDPRPTLTSTVGVTRDADGSLNAGVDLPRVTSHAGQLDTNDREFSERFFGEKPTGPGPPDDDLVIKIGPERDMKVFLVPGAIVAGAVVLGLFGLMRRKG